MTSGGSSASTGPDTADSTGPVPDSTGPGADSSTGAGSSSDGGPIAGPHDGAYTGTVFATFDISGVGSGICSGAMNLTVTAGVAPEVAGSGTCFVMIDQYGFDVVIDVEGSVASPNASGMLSSTINLTPVETTWAGSFAGDTMTAEFEGSFFLVVPVTYTGNWIVDR